MFSTKIDVKQPKYHRNNLSLTLRGASGDKLILGSNLSSRAPRTRVARVRPVRQQPLRAKVALTGARKCVRTARNRRATPRAQARVHAEQHLPRVSVCPKQPSRRRHGKGKASWERTASSNAINFPKSLMQQDPRKGLSQFRIPTI